MHAIISVLMLFCACDGGQCAAADAGQLTVRAMTFNIRFNNPADGENRWAKRREFAAEVIRGQNCDFVGMQEVLPDQIADLLAMMPEYEKLGISREADGRSGEASPIFYRRDRWMPDPAEQGTFWLSDTPEVPASITWGNAWPRIVTWARFIERPTGRAIYVFNTHFDHISEVSRQKGAVLLARRITQRKHPDPVLLTGDLNCGESSAALKYLTGKTPDAPIKMLDTFRAAHPDARQVGTFHAFRGGVDHEKIDYVLALPYAVVHEAEIIRFSREGRYPSDHYPVMAEVGFAVADTAAVSCEVGTKRQTRREHRRHCNPRRR
jgi:endonuclease/exonuclease/phosphatase family metal-dependent hydrolase